METITNPDDLNAVEAALKLKDETGCKVVVITMGPPPAEGMLRELLARGADEAVLVSAREFGGSDTFATSQILAAAVKKVGLEDDDIVFCGRQAIDGDTAQVGSQIAEKLGRTPDFVRGGHQEGRQHGNRQAHAGGRIHDHPGEDAVPADVHQGAERTALYVAERDHGLLRQAGGRIMITTP